MHLRRRQLASSSSVHYLRRGLGLGDAFPDAQVTMAPLAQQRRQVLVTRTQRTRAGVLAGLAARLVSASRHRLKTARREYCQQRELR